MSLEQEFTWNHSDERPFATGKRRLKIKCSCAKTNPCWLLCLMLHLTMFMLLSKQSLKINAPKVSLEKLSPKSGLNIYLQNPMNVSLFRLYKSSAMNPDEMQTRIRNITLSQVSLAVTGQLAASNFRSSGITSACDEK